MDDPFFKNNIIKSNSNQFCPVKFLHRGPEDKVDRSHGQETEKFPHGPSFIFDFKPAQKIFL